MRIPKYDDLLRIFGNILRNCIAFLFSVKENEDDKKLYKKSDKAKRNIVIGTIKKGGVKPGYLVDIESDFFQKVDFIELTRTNNKIRASEKMINEGENASALDELNGILQRDTFSMEYSVFRSACYLKIIVLHNFEEFEACLQLFEEYNITEITKENISLHNIRAYCFAKLRRFQEAHELIDEIIAKVEEDLLKANFLDSKGEFYQLAEEYEKAITYYKKSLGFTHEPPYAFHEETKRKLKECLNALSQDERE